MKDSTFEKEVWRRAVEGVDRPLMYRGKEIGVVKEFSDNLLKFLIERADRQRRQ